MLHQKQPHSFLPSLFFTSRSISQSKCKILSIQSYFVIVVVIIESDYSHTEVGIWLLERVNSQKNNLVSVQDTLISIRLTLYLECEDLLSSYLKSPVSGQLGGSVG